MKSIKFNYKASRLLSLFLLVIMTCMMSSFSVNAASAKNQAFKAYSQYLSQKNIKMLDHNGGYDGDTVPSSEAYFAVVYLDNNSVPELFVKYSARTSSGGIYGDGQLLTFCNNKIKFVTSLGLYPKQKTVYFKKSGLYYDRMYDDMEGYYGSYIKFSNGKTTVVSSEWFDGAENKTTYGYGDHDNISAAEYQKYITKLVGSKKACKVVWHKNTKANRSKYLK